MLRKNSIDIELVTQTRSKPYDLLDDGGLSVCMYCMQPLHAVGWVAGTHWLRLRHNFLAVYIYFLIIFMNNWLYWLTVFYWILQQITGDLRNTKKNNNKRVGSLNISAAVNPAMIRPVTSVQPIQPLQWIVIALCRVNVSLGGLHRFSALLISMNIVVCCCYFCLFVCFVFCIQSISFAFFLHYLASLFFCVYLHYCVPSCLFSQLTLQPRNKAR